MLVLLLHIIKYYHILLHAWGFQLDFVAEGDICIMNFYRLRTKRSTPGWQVKTKSSQLYPWNSLPAAGWGNSLPPPPPPTPLFPLHLLPRGVPPPPLPSLPERPSFQRSRGLQICTMILLLIHCQASQRESSAGNQQTRVLCITNSVAKYGNNCEGYQPICTVWQTAVLRS